jgi:SPP1 gp7 family putative phage head morphogenesis protein
MPEFDFTPKPHVEAAELIRGKAAVSRRVFDQLLPELRARAFTITGIEAANTLQRARDIIAGLPEGKTWSEVKDELLESISPYFGEDEESEKAAERRAELLMRTHGFQAFQAANWRVAQEDVDTTHLQYLATEDANVRDSHLALNGIILPKDDPFWDKHMPPWEWGCRCRVRPMNPDLVDEARAEDEARNPEDRLVMDGPAAEQLRNGTLMRGGRRYDVTAPSDRAVEPGQQAYEWHPENLVIPVEELRERYDAEVWEVFVAWAKGVRVLGEVTLWRWLLGR